MKTIFFEWQNFEEFIKNKYQIDFPNTDFFEEKFSLAKALGKESISIFVDSQILDDELRQLAKSGTKKIFLRCAGFNMLNVDLAKSLGIEVYRVASYSPESIAEFAFALMLHLARKMNLQREMHRKGINGRTIESMGFTLRGKTIGIHGFGKIGKEVGLIAKNGFQMNVLFFDPFVNESDVARKVDSLEELYSISDIVSIHMPLNQQTKNSVNKQILSGVKDRFMLINTARGEIINTKDLKEILDSSKEIFFGTDVWEANDRFCSDLYTNNSFQADHTAFYTEEAVKAILEQTQESLLGESRKENIL